MPRTRKMTPAEKDAMYKVSNATRQRSRERKIEKLLAQQAKLIAQINERNKIEQASAKKPIKKKTTTSKNAPKTTPRGGGLRAGGRLGGGGGINLSTK